MSQTKSSLKKLNTVFHADPTISPPRVDGVMERVLQVQHVAGQKLTRVWYWRFLSDESNFSEVYRESTQREYAEEPVVARIFINHQPVMRKLDKVGVVPEHEHECVMDLAEAIRLGELLDTADGDDLLGYHFFMAKPFDLYQWNGSIYRVEDWKPLKYYRLLNRYVTWEFKGILHSSDHLEIREPLDHEPPEAHPVWRR